MERFVHWAVQQGRLHKLHHFANEILVKIELEQGNWVIIGRVVIRNGDGDRQKVVAEIIYDEDVVLDHVDMYNPGHWEGYLATVQGTLNVREKTIVALAANTYDGDASFGSLIAMPVNDIKPAPPTGG
jgi:hypothetical protein